MRRLLIIPALLLRVLSLALYLIAIPLLFGATIINSKGAKLGCDTMKSLLFKWFKVEPQTGDLFAYSGPNGKGRRTVGVKIT